MVKGSKLETYFNILEVIANGVTKPMQIMRNVNVSYTSLQLMLNFLKKSDFIVAETKYNSKIYQITNKGIDVLSYYLKSQNGLTETVKTVV